MARLSRLLPLLCLAMLSGPPARAEDMSAFAARVKPSIVQLELLGPSGQVVGSGTGFFISEDGLVTTNEHVVEDAQQMRARLPDGSTRQVLGYLARNPERDVALVKLEGTGYSALPLGVDVKVKEGMKVLTVGNPLGLTFSLSEGMVSALRPNGLPEEYQHSEATKHAMIQITAYSGAGSSGSPILSEDGQVIAVLQGGMGLSGNLVFGIPVDVVAKMKADLAPGAVPQPFQEFPWKGAMGSAVFFGLLGVAWAWSKRHEWRRARDLRKSRELASATRYRA
ncbi:serine protease [Pyxidicoccus parkwayensis]|uniref:Serine protease n=1 Tax=Pyxidicoccus parkwayensis TaxID=2813578 RepID=A0ABX7NP41_9BACT|nr:serine protease [Pyxidicoccus parkwaysis]QSQ20540.1 serine protease [Pyxidicoccus parkwaysis]